MKWYIYHQIGCTSSWCCWSQSDTDDKYKEALLLPFFFSIGEVFGIGVGRDMLFMPYVLVMWRELGASDEESCTRVGDGVCSTYPSLGESAMEGRSVPSLLSADHCLLQSLFITWRHAAPSESGVKASISMGRMNSFILNFGGAAHGTVAGWSLSRLSTCTQI